MEPILELPPDLPVHDAAPTALVRHEVVAEWPKGTFVENLAVRADGHVIVSVMSEARLDAVAPDGAVSTLRPFDRPPTGLALIGDILFVAVGEPGAEPPVLWRLDPLTGEGGPWLSLSDMIFANGLTPFSPGALLIADSWQGRLVHLDLASAAATTWVAHEGLTRCPGVDFLPGANGVKRWGAEVTVSSTGRAELYRIPVKPDGSAGAPRLLADRVRVDDFAYDTEGRLYLATHIGHSLDRLERTGARVTLAGPDQGLAGSTACAFGAGDTLYVTTTGGIVAPPDGRLQPARLVRLETGAAGQALDRAWGSPE